MIARRAKIVCTIGPAVETREGIRELIEAGMDVARLNFSHGKHAEHGARFDMIRAESAALGKPVAILQDLCGPKIRTAVTGPAALETGGFLRAVLEGDLLGAVKRADATVSMEDLRFLLDMLCGYAPSCAWGSPEKVTEWLEWRKEQEAELAMAHLGADLA